MLSWMTAGSRTTGTAASICFAELSKFDQLKSALNDLGVTGMTVTQVMGCGIQKGTTEKYRGVPVDSTLLPKIKVEVIVSKIPVDSVVEAAKKALYTGHIGDGKIFVYQRDPRGQDPHRPKRTLPPCRTWSKRPP